MYKKIRYHPSKKASWFSGMLGTKDEEWKVTASYIAWFKKEAKERMNNLRLAKLIKGLMTNNPKEADRMETFIGISNHLFDRTTYWICLRFQVIYNVFYVIPLLLTIFRRIDEEFDIEMIQRYLLSCLVTQSLFFAYELRQMFFDKKEYFSSIWNYWHVL